LSGNTNTKRRAKESRQNMEKKPLRVLADSRTQKLWQEAEKGDHKFSEKVA